MSDSNDRNKLTEFSKLTGNKNEKKGLVSWFFNSKYSSSDDDDNNNNEVNNNNNKMIENRETSNLSSSMNDGLSELSDSKSYIESSENINEYNNSTSYSTLDKKYWMKDKSCKVCYDCSTTFTILVV